MNDNRKVLKQLNSMVILTIITQIIVLIKNSIVASYFGIGAELDAFNLSNRISTFIYSFIGAGISTVIIPYLKDKVNRKSINIFISVIYTSGFLLLISLIIFRDYIIIFSTGEKNNFISLASNILIFTALTGFVSSLIQLTKGILEFYDRFNTEKLIVLFSNFILVIMLLVGDKDIYYYALILLITAILNLTIHVVFVKTKTNFKFKVNFDLNDYGFKEMMTLFFPTMLSTGIYQVSLLIDTLIAARLPTGSISTLSYANLVISMINLLLLANITSFVYPKLVKKDNNRERQNSLINYVLLVNVLMCLLIILFYSSGLEGISILFERGNFTSQDTHFVYLIALILTLSLPTNAIRDLLYRYFYMSKDTFTPFANSLIISIMKIVLSIILSLYLGIYGVVIGTVLTSYFSLIFISLRFKRKFTIYFNKKRFLVENIKIIVATKLSLIIMMIFKNTVNIENTFLGLTIFGLLSISTFVALLKIFKSKTFKLEL